MTITDHPSARPVAAGEARSYRVSPGVQVCPVEGSPLLVLSLVGRPSLRVGADVGRLLAAVADQTDQTDLVGLGHVHQAGTGPKARPGTTASRLAPALGPGWSVDLIEAVLIDLADRGMLRRDDEPDVPAPPARRLTYLPPLTVQLTLWRQGQAGGVVEAVLRLLGRATGRAGALVALLLGVAGLIPGMALLSAEGPLGRPLALSTYLAVTVLSGACVAVHELAHAAACRRRGVMPHRLGVMLFYLSPAAFCDVSSAWRLRPTDRVQIALAGIVANAGMAGLFALAAPRLNAEPAAVCAALAWTNYAMVAFNLLPFVKLDGYLALMSWLDVPQLRTLWIDAVASTSRAWLAGGFRGLRATDRDHPAWHRAMGVAAIAFPMLLVASVATTITSSLLALGVVGAAAVLVSSAALAYGVLRPAARQVRRAWPQRDGGVRFVVRALALILGLGALLGAPVVTERDSIGYARTAEGIVLVDSGNTVHTTDSSWTLSRAGLLPGPVVGSARTAHDVRPCHVPVAALAPQIALPDASAPARCTRVEEVAWASEGAAGSSSPAPSHTDVGVASGPPRQVSPAGWVYHRTIHPALSLLQGVFS